MTTLPPLETHGRHYKAFRAFHQANPPVYELFCRFARELIEKGRERYSADLIWQRLRWHIEIETRGDPDFKLNNNYRTYYGRLFVHDHPEYAEFFETRERGGA